ncbi:MAG: GNAT family N-acetyltransferase [bacterium]|nr:GNAT family N-acetyltransferase [bacterium]
MFNVAVHRKLVNLNNGRRVLLRPLLAEDEERLFALFEAASLEDTRFLKDEVKDASTVRRWIENLNYDRVIPLVAYCDERLVGDVALYRGMKSVRHVGEIRIFLAGDFRGVGLGSQMILEMCEIAKKVGVEHLRAEVILDHVKVIKAFRHLGFELKCTLDDYFMRKDGVTHDVALMVKRLSEPKEFSF